MKKRRSEDSLVERLTRLVGAPSSRVLAGIGDDCAVVRGPSRGDLLLLKADCVVEGRHFLTADSASAVGWKAVCRAVSDLAACGGVPRSALVTCVLRTEQTGRWIDGLYRGMLRAARIFGFEIVGGELARTEGPAMINVSMTGEVAPQDLVRRSGGRAGDAVYVTGVLGGSMVSGWHLKFRPRLDEARWLVRHFRVRAMMDLSDGLAADLPRLARASRTGFEIDVSALPCRMGASAIQALTDGEDFELLLAVGPRDTQRLEQAWAKRWPKVPLTRVGRLARSGVSRGLEHARGFDHFAV